MIAISETKIHSVNKNKFEELKVCFLIKKEDYTPEIEEELFKLSRDGSFGALGFQSIEFPTTIDRNKLLQKLGYLMERYIESEGGSLETEKERIYKKYNIKSRKELSDNDLEYEIDSYQAGLSLK